MIFNREGHEEPRRYVAYRLKPKTCLLFTVYCLLFSHQLHQFRHKFRQIAVQRMVGEIAEG